MTTATTVSALPTEQQAADAVRERLFAAGVGALEWLTIYLGLKLGLYEALDQEPATPAQLARRAQVHTRYAREWLEQQAVCGLVAVDDASVRAEARVYRLPRASADLLLDPDHRRAIAPLGLVVGGIAGALPAVVEAYRAGDGISPGLYGEDLRLGQAGRNRPVFVHHLAEWLAALSDVDGRLRADPPARVADVGCGAGWSTIALARAYPAIRVDGFDVDEVAVIDARRNAAETEVADRLDFEVADAAELTARGAYDLVFAFDAVHAMARPVEALQAMRGLCAPDGAVLVMESRCGEEFTAPGDLNERLRYATSALHSLPVAMAEQPTAATGGVLRPGVLRAYAQQAGFAAVDDVPIDHDQYRLYRLVP